MGGSITYSERKDADLVRLTRDGDKAAFGELVRRYENAAYATALSYAHCPDVARDLVQDAFVNAYCKLAQLRDGAGFGAWLRTIVSRRALEWLRRSRTVQFVGESPDGVITGLDDAGGERFADRQQRRDILEAVGMLPAKYREVVLMYYLNHFPTARVARIMSLPESTVRGRLHQARQKLKDLMVHEKELAMSKADIQQEVENAVAKIARREVNRSIALQGTTHIVLFCGVDADVEICRTDGNEAVLTGTIAAIGLDDESARRSTETVQVMTDVVDDFIESGPHEGQVFGGTQGTSGHGYVGLARSSSFWHPGKVFNGKLYTELLPKFPEMKPREEAILTKLRQDWGRVTRVSVLREKLDDLTLPTEAYVDAVRSVFHPNFKNETICHGDNGRADFVLAVPAGVGVTVLRSRSIQVNGLRSDINAVQADGLELEDIEGDVTLLDCHVKSARRVRGRYLQSHYHVWGGNDDTEVALIPAGRPRTELRELSGEIIVDLLSVDLEVSELEGDAVIRNRLGPTRYHLSDEPEKAQCLIESECGEVITFLREEAAKAAGIVARTICGRINTRPFADITAQRNIRMGWEGLGFGTTASPPEPKTDEIQVNVHRLDVNLQIITRSGEISFEVVK